MYLHLSPAALAPLIMAFSAPLNWPCVQSLGKTGLKKQELCWWTDCNSQSSISWRPGLVVQESGKLFSSSLLQFSLVYLHRPLSWCCAGTPAASEGVRRQGGALLLWVEFVAPHRPERAGLPLTCSTQTQYFLICTLCLQTGSWSLHEGLFLHLNCRTKSTCHLLHSHLHSLEKRLCLLAFSL